MRLANHSRIAAGSLKIRSKTGRIDSRSSRVSLTSKTMMGRSVIGRPFVRGRTQGADGRLPDAWLTRARQAGRLPCAPSSPECPVGTSLDQLSLMTRHGVNFGLAPE